MKITTWIGSIGMAWALLASPNVAQEAPRLLTVREALEVAEAQSPALGQLRARRDAVAGERLASYGLDAPRLMYAREGIPTAGGDFGEQRWVLTQGLDFPLQTYFRLQRVGMQGESLDLAYEAARRTLRGRVKTAYAEVLYAQELLHLSAQGVTLAESLQEAVAAQVAAGAAAELDALKVELQLSEARSVLEDRVRLLDEARYALYQTIGIDPDAQAYGIVLPDTMTYVDVLITQDEVLARLTAQPELSSADATVRAAGLGIRETRAAAWPRLELGYWPQDFGAGYRFHAFEVGISIPLWFPLNHRGAIQQARARQQIEAWGRQDIYLTLKREIERAWHGYITSKQTIDRYAGSVQALADELLNRTREGYQLGQLDLLTLLDTQRTYLAAQSRYYEALRAYYTHLIQLERYLDRDIVFAP